MPNLSLLITLLLLFIVTVFSWDTGVHNQILQREKEIQAIEILSAKSTYQEDYLSFLKFLQRRDSRILKAETRNILSTKSQNQNTDIFPWRQFVDLNIGKAFVNDCMKERTNDTFTVSYNGTQQDFTPRDWYLLNSPLQNYHALDSLFKSVVDFTGSKYQNVSDFLSCQDNPYLGYASRSQLGVSDKDIIQIDLGGEGRKTTWSMNDPTPFDWGGYYSAININPTMHVSNGDDALIPYRLYGCGFPLPFVNDTVDVISIDNAPIAYHVAHEIMRVVRPRGLISVGGLEGTNWESISSDPRYKSVLLFTSVLGDPVITPDEQGITSFFRWTWLVSNDTKLK
eukprot:TRINITY_DN2494_c1_g1_i1.p1 TRINITY_DN2494_c1_g1~~TRINITY_DN2494_c1_g1_i1.p1  ORF type:complete len:340 (+),score=58.47 TRINITY_DN2494_c1_g1_i1:415-1434(+)